MGGGVVCFVGDLLGEEEEEEKVDKCGGVDVWISRQAIIWVSTSGVLETAVTFLPEPLLPFPGSLN